MKLVSSGRRRELPLLLHIVQYYLSADAASISQKLPAVHDLQVHMEALVNADGFGNVVSHSPISELSPADGATARPKTPPLTAGNRTGAGGRPTPDVKRSAARVVEITGDAKALLAGAGAAAGLEMDETPEVVAKAAGVGPSEGFSKVVRRQASADGPAEVTRPAVSTSTYFVIAGYVALVSVVAHRLSDCLQARFRKHAEGDTGELTSFSSKAPAASEDHLPDRFRTDVSFSEGYRIGDGDAAQPSCERSSEMTRW
eukprot:TRINITY_DN37757_c0_g1_i2.p1 TRINITY_DN37757_c0_g1~~TRINITY_DN37757_c0_g1_i2.p1  ORF type:complete len:257 (-),score=46.62 TRINITY_DN37757_c0_g1_i2:21-791(-)